MLFEPLKMLPYGHKRLMKRQSIGSLSMFWRNNKTMQESLPLRTDSALLRLYHQGDQQAFEQLVERYQAPLFCFLMRILQDPDITADVMQHVWIQLAFASCRGGDAASLRSWLFQVARNRAIDLLRIYAREKVRLTSLAAMATNVENAPDILWLHDPRPGPEVLAEQRAMYDALLQVLATFPRNSQQIVYLRLWHQLSYASIGQRLGMSALTAKTSFHRSRLRLSKALADWVDTGVRPKKGGDNQTTGVLTKNLLRRK